MRTNHYQQRRLMQKTELWWNCATNTKHSLSHISNTIHALSSFVYIIHSAAGCPTPTGHARCGGWLPVVKVYFLVQVRHFRISKSIGHLKDQLQRTSAIFCIMHTGYARLRWVTGVSPRGLETLTGWVTFIVQFCDWNLESWDLESIEAPRLTSNVAMVRVCQCQAVWSSTAYFLADRRPLLSSTVALLVHCCVRLSSSVTLCIVAKRCVLEQKLLLRAYRKSYNY